MTISVFILEEVLAALGGILLLLALLLALSRTMRLRGERRNAVLVAESRPILLCLAGSDDPDPADLETLAALGDRQWQALEPTVVSLLLKMRGSAHTALVDLLARRGSLSAARRRLSRPGSVSRARAAELLGSAEDRTVVAELSAALADRSQEVRAMSARALGLIGDPVAARPLLDRLTTRRSVPRPLLAYTLVQLGSGAVGTLIDGLADGEPAIRALAAEVLGLIGDVSAAGPLVRTVDLDPFEEVRIRAARALGLLSAPSALPCLLELLGPPHSAALRVAAAIALGDLQASGAVGDLDEALDDADFVVGHMAAIALLASGTDGQIRLDARSVDESRPRARAQAREVLAVVGLHAIESPATREESEVRMELGHTGAQTGLGKPPDVDHPVELLGSTLGTLPQGRQ